MTASSASTNAGRSPGRAASIFGANAATACLAPLKLTSRGWIPAPAAAAAMTVRSRLYATRWAQISFSTISGVLHRRTSIFITDLSDRMPVGEESPHHRLDLGRHVHRAERLLVPAPLLLPEQDQLPVE